MTDQQYDALKKNLETIIANQDIINRNVGAINSKIDELQGDMGTAIRNQQLLGNDQDKLIKQVRDIEYQLDKLNK